MSYAHSALKVYETIQHLGMKAGSHGVFFVLARRLRDFVLICSLLDAVEEFFLEFRRLGIGFDGAQRAGQRL